MATNYHEEITIEDLSRIWVVMPNDDGIGTTNFNAVSMTDRQFRTFASAKAEQHGVRMLVPMGKISLDTRVRMINYLIRAGIRIYMTPKPKRPEQ